MKLKELIKIMKDTQIEVYGIDLNGKDFLFTRYYLGEAKKCYIEILNMKVYDIFTKDNSIKIGVMEK